MKYNCILIRYGEMGLKSKKKKPFFEKKLVTAFKHAFRINGITEFRVQNFLSRFIIHTDHIDEVSNVLKRIPGVQSFSPAYNFGFESLDDIVNELKPLLEPLVAGKTYCVKCKRVGNHPFSSMDASAKLGGELNDVSAGVEFKTPDIRIDLEIRDKFCYVFVGKIDGIGGLPPGTGGRALCLFSGGIDSPVAAFEMLKRGCIVDFMLINLTGDKNYHDVANVYNYLASRFCFGYIPRFYIVEGKDIISLISEKVPDTLRQIALKIAFYHVGAEAINVLGHNALITGEALAQKSTQTLESLSFIQRHSPGIFVLRPLIGMDKLEIFVIADKIGTLRASEKVKEYCNLAAGRVTTAPIEEHIKKIPSFIDISKDVVSKLSKHEGFVEFDRVESRDLKLNNPSIIDIRSLAQKESLPIESDYWWPFPSVYDHYTELDKEKEYIIVCPFGVLAEDVAYTLEQKHFKAVGMSYLEYKSFMAKKNE